MKNTYFITAIDTNVGKTLATGLLAKQAAESSPLSASVITMKIAQTGCQGIAEDIKKHRQIMGIDLQTADKKGLTCPYVFPYPASPHFAAELANSEIDCQVILTSIKILQKQYDSVFIEGVGGLMVPLNQQQLLSDFLAEQQLPTILLTGGQLGSINHTLLSLSLIKHKAIPLHGVIFNHYPDKDCKINENTRVYLKNYVQRHFPAAMWKEMPYSTTPPTLV